MDGCSDIQRDMRREFAGREDLIAYLREQFPHAAAVDDHVPETRGGRAAAEDALARIDPAAYGKTRNHLDGAVTRLSPYIRHGVLSLAEVRDAALAQAEAAGAEKLVSELGWRDYFQRVYAAIGEGVWHDREPYKTGFTPADYSDDLPDDVREGRTGLACIDAFARDLIETGWLHNHARMWLAAYVIHWRRVKWQAGACWFLQHLLDGDPASNNLSWQWVASTFSHKPYIFNRENLERFTAGRYCQTCPHYGGCPFEGDYEALERHLFPSRTGDDRRQGERRR
ncbi:MAG: FAD-binding domain-containing protein [Anaerolineae bacterium]